MKTRTSKRVRTRQPESQPELPETIQTIFNKYNKRKTRTISTSSSSKRDDTPSSAETRQKDPAAYLYEDSVAPWPDEEGTPAKTSTPCHSLSSFEKFRRLDLDLSSISVSYSTYSIIFNGFLYCLCISLTAKALHKPNLKIRHLYPHLLKESKHCNLMCC
eukprot:m.59444 g.59444  ORF g.59444 m.59444 type:complete len:160 (+) comp11247_c0_seq3:244-723(+)